MSTSPPDDGDYADRLLAAGDGRLLSYEEQKRLIHSLCEGTELDLACRVNDVTRADVVHTFRKDRKFKKALESARGLATADLYQVLRLAGMEGNLGAAQFLLTMQQKQAEIRRLNQQRDKALAIQEKALSAAASSAGGAGKMGFDLRNLADEEMHAFGDFLEAISVGAEFTPDDALKFVQLFTKTIRPPQAPGRLEDGRFAAEDTEGIDD